MKVNLIALTILSLSSLPSFARENCEPMATKAAMYMSETINGDNRSLTGVTTLSNTKKEQIVEVIVDDIASGGGAHVGYTVTVERNPSPIEANQVCARVIKLELTSEE